MCTFETFGMKEDDAHRRFQMRFCRFVKPQSRVAFSVEETTHEKYVSEILPRFTPGCFTSTMPPLNKLRVAESMLVVDDVDAEGVVPRCS